MARGLRFAGLLTPFLFVAISGTAHSAPCPIPNTLTNGQATDAIKLMDNLNALANCTGAVVTTTGTPTTGSIAVVSGTNTISTGNLSGDVTTANGTSTTLSASGVVAGTYSSANIAVDSKGRVTAAANGSGGGSNSNIVMALGAAWVKEMVLNGASIAPGSARSVKSNLGGYVGMRMVANTNVDFAGRLFSTVTYVVPAGAVAFVVEGKFNDQQRANQSQNYYNARLYNVTQSRVAAGANPTDPQRTVPSQAPGNVPWSLSFSGLLSSDYGDFTVGNMAAYYPMAGVAGDTLRLEAWSSGDGAYRMQDMAVYLVVVSTTTGDPIP